MLFNKKIMKGYIFRLYPNDKQIELREQVLYGLFSAFWFITIPVTIIDIIYKKIKEKE